MLAVGAWWFWRQAPGTPFHEMAIAAAVASVIPVLVGSGPELFSDSPDLAAWTLTAGAAATLGLTIANRWLIRMGCGFLCWRRPLP